jgi:hypothetical protein
MALVKLRARDVRLNEPVTFPIYSSSGKLLLNAGHRIASEAQLERLFANGACRDDGAKPAPAVRRADTLARAVAPLLISSARLTPAFSSPAEFPRLPRALESFELTIEGADEARVSAVFVGTVEGHGLVVSAPHCDALQRGVPVHAKFSLGRDVYTFQCSVVAHHPEFGGLTLLDCPQHVRRHPGNAPAPMRAALPARVIRNDGECFEATVDALGNDHIALTIDRKLLEPGEHFRLTLRIDTDDTTHALLLNCVAAAVRTVRGGLHVDAQLGATSAQARSVLKRLVSEPPRAANVVALRK